MTPKTPLFVGALAMILTIADTAAKNTALKILPEAGSIGVIGNIVGLQLHKNHGVVANIAIPMTLIIALTIAILCTLAWWLHVALKAKQTWVVTSLLVLISGAMGNLTDRIAHGFTTDYIILFGRSVVNISDALIVLGVIGIITAPKDKKKQSLPN